MKLNYTKESVDGKHLRSSSQAAYFLCEDWLAQDAELDTLRDAAAAVVEAFEGSCAESFSSDGIDNAIEALRIAAGIKAPPQDAKGNADA